MMVEIFSWFVMCNVEVDNFYNCLDGNRGLNIYIYFYVGVFCIMYCYNFFIVYGYNFWIRRIIMCGNVVKDISFLKWIYIILCEG